MPFASSTEEMPHPTELTPDKVKAKFAVCTAMEKLKLANKPREAAVGGGGSAAISIDEPSDENGSCTHRGKEVNGLIAEDSAAFVSGSVAGADDEVVGD